MMRFLLKKPFILLLAGAIGFAFTLPSCRKKGNNEKITGTNVSANDLIPTDSGSWWLKRANDSSVTLTTATGRDSFISNNVYDYFEMKDTSNQHITPQFYGKNDGYYLTLINLAIDNAPAQYMPAIICTVAPQAGDTWTNTSLMNYSGINVAVKTEGEVLTTTATVTLNGHTYHNVIKTKNDLKAKPNNTPVWIDCGSLNMSLVKGVGVLESDLQVNIVGIVQKHITNKLLDYHIAQ